MEDCTQATITAAAIASLIGIQFLDTIGCSRDVRLASAQLLGIDYESESEFEFEE